MLRILFKLLLLIHVATAHSQPLYETENYPNYVYDDVVDDYEEEYVPDDPPTFLSNSQEFVVEKGGVITFPCDVENLGDQVLMFKHIKPDKGDRTLFVGELALKPASIKFTKIGNSFRLSGVTRRHAGKYVCRIETIPVTELEHTLDVQYPASIRHKSDEVQRVVQGSSVTLECLAEGNPPAAISWSRHQGHIPSGVQSVEDMSIILENVDRHVEGTYVCTASNGIGDPASASMKVEVEYPPEVSTEQAILHTSEGDEAKLMCIVHGRPAPRVVWTKGGQQINPDHHIAEHDSLHRHTLTIHKVREDDFGDYTCTAENNLGQKAYTLTLTGLPKVPKMTSSPAGGERTSYTLTWETESYTPIIQYRLQYRKFEANVTTHAPGLWDDRLYSPQSSQENFTGPIHHMSHALEVLEPATDYEVTVSVENKFGWSETSGVFKFYTRKEDPTTTTTTTTTTTLAPEPENIAPVMEEVAVGQSSSGCETTTLSLMLWILVLGVFLS